MKKMRLLYMLFGGLFSGGYIQAQDSLQIYYRLEGMGMLGAGSYAPLWLTANRYGVLHTEPQAGLLRGGLFYQQTWGQHWGIRAGWICLVACRKAGASRCNNCMRRHTGVV